MASQVIGNNKPAFRFDVSPQAVKRVEAVGLPDNPRRRWIVAGIVAFLHLMVFIFRPAAFWSTPPMSLEESWEVDMEFLGEINTKAPQETALPNSQKSDEEAVPMNVLPQLPKKFEITEQTPPEEKTFAEEKDEKAEQAIAEEKKVEAPDKPAVPKTEEDANKVDMDDLRKRLAVEKLKQENKVSERMKAQKDALAKLKQETSTQNADANSGSSGAMVGLMRNNAFQSALKSAVQRNFSLPESFKYSQKKMAVPLIVVIGDRGELLSYKLNGSSGNDVYDNAAVAALKNSEPLPAPPKEFVGKEIQFNF